MKTTMRVLLVGAAGGYTAGKVMDRVTTWFYQRQSDASKQREGELLPRGRPHGLSQEAGPPGRGGANR